MKSKEINETELSKFLDFYNSRTFDANCFNEDGSLDKNYNSFKKNGIIATILEEHWDKVYYSNKTLIDKYRPNADIEIHFMIK